MDDAVADVRAQGAERNPAFLIPLGPAHLGAAEASGDLDLHALGAGLDGALNRLLDRLAERDAPLELSRHVLRQQIGALSNRKVKLEIKEIRQPELDAYLVAMNIAQQLTRRIAFRKAMKQAVQRTMKAGAKGVRVAVAGRLGGSEMARREWDREGRIPLGTLKADISYGQVHAHTTYGRIGVKVWIYRGDVPTERRREVPQAQPAVQGA